MVEMVVIVAILGILVGIAFLVLPNDRTAVNQAANGLAQQYARARLEALKNDRFAGVSILTSGNGSYYVCVDQDNDDHQCHTSEAVQTVTMGQGSYAKVRITAVSAGAAQFMFDPRGIPMNSGGTVTFANHSGSYTTSVVITAAGRASVQ